MGYKCYQEDVVLTDAEEIDAYKAEQKSILLSEKLVGEFDENGEYVISQQHMQALVDLNKFVTNAIDNSLFAKANVANHVLKFRLDYDVISDDVLEAKLYILEPCLNILNEEIETFIGRYFDEKTPEFKNKAKKIFNIYNEIDSLGKDMRNSSQVELIEYIDNLSALGSYLNIMSELQAEMYVIKMLKLLASSKNAEEILKDYKIKESAINNDVKIGTKNIYIRLKKALDETIRKHGGINILEPEIQTQVKIQAKEYTSSLKTAEETKMILISSSKQQEKTPPTIIITTGAKKKAKTADAPKKKTTAKKAEAKKEAKKDKPKAKDWGSIEVPKSQPITIVAPIVAVKPEVTVRIEIERNPPAPKPITPQPQPVEEELEPTLPTVQLSDEEKALLEKETNQLFDESIIEFEEIKEEVPMNSQNTSNGNKFKQKTKNIDKEMEF